MKVAALDLGSNSFLLLICNVESGKITYEILDDIETTRLGQGVHKSKRLAPEALERAEACLKKYAEISSEHKVEKIVAVATSAARDAENGKELLAVGKKYGIDIEIIAGDLEAELTYLGGTSDRTNKEGLCVIDVGGGSTEIMLRLSSGKLWKKSLNIGSVRLTEMFVSSHPVSDREFLFIKDHCRTQVRQAFTEPLALREVVAVAGTPVTVARIAHEVKEHSELQESTKVDTLVLETWMNKLAKMSVAERQELIGMEEKRADVIVAGSVCLWALLKHLDVPRFTVSKKGVRHGLALWTSRPDLIRI